ncbi:Fatty acid desaturase [Tumidithrix helvetica PCC 7403]|uniref:fatty acid desaturase n=1 Tax=Tumidithrix helvetica TaxID=3457545 RepID=UPI003CB88987
MNSQTIAPLNSFLVKQEPSLYNFASYQGIAIGLGILGLWAIALYFCLSMNLAEMPILFVILAVLGRTFLHTGLFIVAHDAAHGTVFTGDRRVNDWFGRIAIAIYALLPYAKFLKNHGLHHKNPGRAGDPDFHDGRHKNAIAWYMAFMVRYLDRRQLVVIFVGFTVIFHSLRLGMQVSPINLLLFWILPILLSSMQLFLFGTFLTHREPQQGYTNRHHAMSSNFPVMLSFLACYHFGYHWEHHEYPHLPWYKLPSVRK